MGRRLLSHLLITLAIFSLTATFFIWVVDATILNPQTLTKALQDGGVPSAIATVIPEQASKQDNSNDCQGQQSNQPNGQQNNQPGTQQGNQPSGGQQNNSCQPTDPAKKAQDQADMKAKIAAVVTPDYVNQKLTGITSSVITFMKNGSPEPVVDLTDFPAKLRASGVEVGSDIDKNFNKPIEINNNGSLNVLPKAYSILKLAKYAGAVLFVLLLVAEWFVAAKGNKLHLIGRIFLHAAFWYTVYWAAIVVVPSHLLPKLKDKVNAGASTNTLIDAVTKSVQHLFAQYFLAFAIVCWVLAIALYLARHVRKHVDQIQAVPAAKGKAKPLPNKR